MKKNHGYQQFDVNNREMIFNLTLLYFVEGQLLVCNLIYGAC